MDYFLREIEQNKNDPASYFTGNIFQTLRIQQQFEVTDTFLHIICRRATNCYSERYVFGWF